MTKVLVEPEDLISEFLRAQVTEPTRIGLANRQTNRTETFSGDASETEFTINSKPLQCINTVKISSIEQSKHIAYTIDLRNSKVVFASAPASGTNNISIDYDFGDTWIYADKPRTDITEDSYPRIGVTTLTQPENPMGIGVGGPYWLEGIYQIDVVAYKGMKCKISNEVYEGADLAKFLARAVINALKNVTLKTLSQKLYTPRIMNNFPPPFDASTNQFRRIIELSLDAQDI